MENCVVHCDKKGIVALIIVLKRYNFPAEIIGEIVNKCKTTSNIFLIQNDIELKDITDRNVVLKFWSPYEIKTIPVKIAGIIKLIKTAYKRIMFDIDTIVSTKMHFNGVLIVINEDKADILLYTKKDGKIILWNKSYSECTFLG